MGVITMINILLVDDHHLVRTALKLLLTTADKDNIAIIGEAASGEEAIQLANELNPDVILMDLQMPGIGGLEATRKIIQHNPKIKILIVTVCEEEPIPSYLLHVGAVGYINKTANVDELIMAIHKVYAGKRHITPAVAEQMALYHTHHHSEESPIDKLSQRETQVMWMVVRGYTVNLIAEKLHLSPKTINTYRYRMFEKLHIKNDVHLTHLALHHGMLDENVLPVRYQHKDDQS
jgi:two-component system invasion response regulator UvrY